MRKWILFTAALVLFSACNGSQVKFNVTRSYDCDVLVIGGGPAGTASAISAARHGAKTILAERNGVLGGTATSGLVAPFMSSTTPDGKTFLIRGLYEELVNRMVAQTGSFQPRDTSSSGWPLEGNGTGSSSWRMMTSPIW